MQIDYEKVLAFCGVALAAFAQLRSWLDHRQEVKRQALLDAQAQHSTERTALEKDAERYLMERDKALETIRILQREIDLRDAKIARLLLATSDKPEEPK